jgi:hypothetical protein
VAGETELDGSASDGVFRVAPGAQAVFGELRMVGATAVLCRDGAQCTLERVHVTRVAGPAAVRCEGAAACRFDRTEIADNRSEVGVACGRCDFRDSTVSGNDGAGVVWERERVSLVGSRVVDNAGVGLRGSKHSRDLVLGGSLVRGNRGGGIETGGRVTIERSAIVGNARSEGCGGGIRLEGGRTSGSLLSASTLSGNTAPKGGGLCLLWTGGNLNPYVGILGSTLTANRAEAGGGIFVVPELQHLGPPGPGFQLERSILAGNQAKSGADCVAGPLKRSRKPSASSLGWNLVGDASRCELSAAEGDRLGTTAEPLHPKLGALADRGGATPVHVPLDGSPALDRVPAPACARSPITAPTYVQHRVQTGADSQLARTGVVDARDTRWLVLSGWFEFLRPIGKVEHLLSVGDGRTREGTILRVAREASGQLAIQVWDAEGKPILDARSRQIVSSSEPHSLVFGFNAGINSLDAFLDDVELLFDRGPGSRGSIPYATRPDATWRLFGRHDGGGEAFVGRVADVWIDDEFLSVDSGSHRYDFYDLNNRPLDLGPDARVATKRGDRPPLFWLGRGMRADDWNRGTNRGRGGPFAVAAGFTDVIEQPPALPPSVDQHGRPRPRGERCDVGAFERD